MMDKTVNVRKPSSPLSFPTTVAIFAAILLVAVAIHEVAASSASNWDPNRQGTAKSKPGRRPDPTIVEKVNRTTSIIAVKQGKTSVVYSVDAATRIIVNGKPGNLSDIKPGMRVSVNTGSDANKAVKIDAGSGR
jgi:hypothetical protein